MSSSLLKECETELNKNEHIHLYRDIYRPAYLSYLLKLFQVPNDDKKTVSIVVKKLNASVDILHKYLTEVQEGKPTTDLTPFLFCIGREETGMPIVYLDMQGLSKLCHKVNSEEIFRGQMVFHYKVMQNLPEDVPTWIALQESPRSAWTFLNPTFVTFISKFSGVGTTCFLGRSIQNHILYSSHFVVKFNQTVASKFLPKEIKDTMYLHEKKDTDKALAQLKLERKLLPKSVEGDRDVESSPQFNFEIVTF